ncbi:hypothetical protein [Actinophytocola sp. NPDC049390]|uniref:hypothetical protein n=1 Tax=Actinophytocola sp. NPDC049390 TaxID=3363894 RepID=UPI003799FF2E
MSGAGTSLIAFKTALVDRLGERPGLAGVAVLYARSDVDSLPDEAIWLEKAETESLEFPAFRPTKMELQEVYDLDVTVQVRLTQGQTQRQADARALELLAELQQQLAEAPQLCDDIQWAKPESWKYHGGQLDSGHGCRFDIVVRVHARME